MLFDIKKLETEEGRREYYKYDPTDPTSLRHHVEPYLDPSFNDELLDRYGTDVHGEPRFRFVWAGTLPAPAFRDNGDTVIEYEGKKYPFMRLRIQKGFTYLNDKNQKVTVTTLQQVPKGKLWVPEIDFDDLGIMKFAFEMKFTAEELVQMGWYPKPGDELQWCVRNGKRYRPLPNPNGEYIKATFVETPEGEYRDVVQNDVDLIHDFANRSLNETEAEYVVRKRKEREELAKKEAENDAINYAAHVERGIIKGEKRLARGQIIYG